MANEVQLTDATFDQEVLKAEQPVLVDFWAPWCGPCRMLGPIIEELAKEFDGKVRVAKLNTDDNPASAGRFKIQAIPTLLFFKEGKLVEQMQGVHSKEEIKKHLNSLLS